MAVRPCPLSLRYEEITVRITPRVDCNKAGSLGIPSRSLTLTGVFVR